MKAKAIIVDLDGTLYDARDRQQKYLLSGKKDFDAFHRAAFFDEPHQWCRELIKAMKLRGFNVIFTSGRDDTFRYQTEMWLLKQIGLEPDIDYLLFMRPAGDFTADDVMKRGWYEATIKDTFEVLFCVDDRKRVTDMWRSLGLTCLHCAEGNF